MRHGLSMQERERYRRQLMLQGFTPEHQQRLKDATALVAGIGGLGGTAALYLAAAGIGRLVLVHAGNLTLSNMNRQVLMEHAWIGKSRVVQGRKAIERINPDVEVEIFDERITKENIGTRLAGVSIVLSARPNFCERRILNQACVQKGVLLVEAAMNGMEGYLLNVVPGVTPCLSCLFPEDDPQWQELGFPVLGAVSGLLGCMMSIEALKLLTGYGTPLRSKMLTFNTMDMEFKKLRTRRDRACPVCGDAMDAGAARRQGKEAYAIEL